MINIIYLSVVLIVAFMAIAAGFRKGISGQVSSLLGFAFGAVGARVLTPGFSSTFTWAGTVSQAPEFSDFTTNLVCAVIIYTVIYLLFTLLAGVLNSALSLFGKGMLNRLTGAFFSLVKNLLWLSILYNLLLCFSPASGLLMYERSNDGNPVAAVMALTPAVLGCYGAEDFAHFNQLKEAKLISCNFSAPSNVIIMNNHEIRDKS